MQTKINTPWWSKTRQQQLSEVVLDAEVKLGELIAEMPTAQGERTDKQHGNSVVTKLDALKEIGFDKMQASRLETLARYPGIIAHARGRVRVSDLSG